VGQKTWRGWQSWARRLLLQGLDRPGHWDATGSEWVATSYGVMGQPVEWLAQGVERVASRWGGAFMAHAIVVPLFIPRDDRGTAYFKRLSSSHTGAGFDNPTPETREDLARDLSQAINQQGQPFLESAGTLAGFLEHAKERQRSVLEDTGGLAYAEDVGYTALLLGDVRTAQTQLTRYAREGSDDNRGWVRESRDRCAQVAGLLDAGPEQGRAQLAAWAAQRAALLGLARHQGA
jgi:hypothetical protein